MKSKLLKLESFVSLILLVLILTKIQLVTFIGSFSFTDNILVVIFFLSAVCGIVGIFLNKHWGYFSTYIFILVSAIAFGIAPIPFVKILFPINSLTFSVILTSILLFSFTLFLHVKLFLKTT